MSVNFYVPKSTNTFAFSVSNNVRGSELNQNNINEQEEASPIRIKHFDKQVLKNLLGTNPFFLEAKKVEEAAKILNCTPIELLEPLVNLTKCFARPPISDYEVSVLGLGRSGNIYLGVNLEFKKTPLNQTIHGEQFLVVNAKNHGEKELVGVALSVPPCGHCRQFFNEISEDNQMKILTPGNPNTDLKHLLPKAFGPKELGKINNLFMTALDFKKSDHACKVTAKAVDAARASYAPYTESISGVAIKTKDGEIFAGSCLENVAYNPSISPLQAALVDLVASNRQYDEIIEVVLAEKMDAKVSQEDTTVMILKRIAPNAEFRLEYI